MKSCCHETFKLALEQVRDLIEREQDNICIDQLLLSLHYAISELEKEKKGTKKAP